MNVFYEEDGGFKVGAILADNGASLQVESPHGKRSKIKLSHILFRFDGPIAHFMEDAQKSAESIDVDFLWECSSAAEFTAPQATTNVVAVSRISSPSFSTTAARIAANARRDRRNKRSRVSARPGVKRLI